MMNFFNIIVMFLVAHLLFFCNNITSNSNFNRQNEKSKTENFDEFINLFCNDSVFQISRIKFPLKNKVYNTDVDEFEDLVIIKDKWRYIDFSKLKEPEYIKSIKEVKGTYFINVQILDTGVSVTYIFNEELDKWYLIEIVDEST